MNEYDYDEELMKEHIPIINVPMLIPPIISPEINSNSQQALFMDLQRIIED